MSLLNLKTRFFLTSALAVSLLISAGCSNQGSVTAYKAGAAGLGDQAPDFSLPDSTGHFVKLSDAQPGWYLVLVFYRGHWCNACLNQLLNLKQDFASFAPLHTALAAISVDSIEDSAAFNDQWRFPFPLLSDTSLKLIDAYGIRHPNGHGVYDIARPTVVILDPHHVIRFKYVGTSPVDRPTDNEIISAIQQIQQIDSHPSHP